MTSEWRRFVLGDWQASWELLQHPGKAPWSYAAAAGSVRLAEQLSDAVQAELISLST